MSEKKLKIVWADGLIIDLKLADNPVTEFYYSCIRRLQHLDLFFGPRETPFHPMISDRDQTQKLLKTQLSEMNVDVDVSKLHDQCYLNYLHDIYLQQCSTSDRLGYAQWTHIHDTIHLLETQNNHRNHLSTVMFNYRNNAGLLYKKFDRSYLKYATQSVEPGTCFLTEQELGKNPLTYYQDQEPNDIDTVCRISKPWVNLIPTLNVATEHTSSVAIPDNFVSWFETYKDRWCDHWKITNWSPAEIGAKIPVGHITNFAEFLERFRANVYPIRITQ